MSFLRWSLIVTSLLPSHQICQNSGVALRSSFRNVGLCTVFISFISPTKTAANWIQPNLPKFALSLSPTACTCSENCFQRTEGTQSALLTDLSKYSGILRNSRVSLPTVPSILHFPDRLQSPKGMCPSTDWAHRIASWEFSLASFRLHSIANRIVLGD